jgi:phosphohistidine phosphatase SixA
MRRRVALSFGRLLLISLLFTVSTTQASSLSGPALVRALRMGGYVILMRHASSPRTPPDASEADADNPQHERQLDSEGRSSARNLGEALRALRIPIGAVLSSPTYRALQTIEFAQLGTPMTFVELGDSGRSMRPDAGGTRGAWLRARVSEPPSPGKDTLIVTHLPNIVEVFSQEAAGLVDGEALILRRGERGGAQIVAHIKISEWRDLDSDH